MKRGAMGELDSMSRVVVASFISTPFWRIHCRRKMVNDDDRWSKQVKEIIELDTVGIGDGENVGGDFNKYINKS